MEIVIEPNKLRQAIREAKLEFLNTFEDDHELCVEIGVTLKGESKRYVITALWIVPEFFSELVYACKGKKYKRERDGFAEYINDCVVQMVNDCGTYDDKINDEDAQVIESLKKFSK